MTGITCALAGGGGVIYTGSATVTVGQYTEPTFGFVTWGYTGVLAGSVTPATWAGTGFPILQLNWFDTTNDFVAFVVSGNAPNSGWETMTVGGVPFSRASANYGYDGNTSWLWNVPTPANPFGFSVGATRLVVWS
jgi:hypothetical protein